MNKEKSLEQLLMEYRDSDYYGFHMPGHKRNTVILDKENNVIKESRVNIEEIPH